MAQSNDVPELLVLAAVERAMRHREADGAPAWEVYAHLGLPRRSVGARAARRQLDALTASGALERSRRRSIEQWSPTPAGKRRLHRALRVAGTVELPESPQHAAWRSARMLAEQEIDRFTDAARVALTESLALIDAGTDVRSDMLFEAAERLRFVLKRLGSATYCLREWEEPSDRAADVDRHEDPGDTALDPSELASVQARRRWRRNVRSWRSE